jgi:rfaE bifunctional protein kinase chain/domain
VSPQRFQTIAQHYAALRVAIVGDFCLDRYLEIDPARGEISIETGLPVHNVINVRSQPGGAGTILNNLLALSVGRVVPVGFVGQDGEGFELRRALEANPAVSLEHLLQTGLRRTFTYCKPLVTEAGKAPIELNRLDFKNWTPTPALVEGQMIDALSQLASEVDAFVLLDQVDSQETGVVTPRILEAIAALLKTRPELLIIADSRRSLRNYPPVTFKMNAAELEAMVGAEKLDLPAIQTVAANLARRGHQRVFVTLSERGILGASPQGEVEHVPALPTHGPIDIVGAGDAVTANLAAALAAKATLREALEIAMAAASIVIHQLGTTGTASLQQIGVALAGGRPSLPSV